MLALQISSDTVPDFATAKTELFKIWDLILSSEITWKLFKELFFRKLIIVSLFLAVAWKAKI